MSLSRSAKRALDEYESPEAAVRYDGVHRGRARHRREERAIRRAFRNVPTGASVLDLPCGTGRMFPVLRAMGYRVTAADGSAAMVAYARDTSAQAGRAPAGGVHVASVFETGFPDDAFDAVLCNRLFHHFAESETRRAGLAELRRICTGTIVVSFFCNLSLDARRTRRRRSRSHHRSGREAISFQSFRADAEASGLEIVRVHRTLPGISQQWYCVARRATSGGSRMLALRSRVEVREPCPLLPASSDDPVVFQSVWQLLEIGGDWRARRFIGERDSLFLKGMQIRTWTRAQLWARRFHIGLEFRNLVRFHALDLPFPRPLAWGAQTRVGLPLRAFLMERTIPDSIDFERFIANPPQGAQTPVQRRRVFERVGSAVRRMHDQRVFHGDLPCRNVLVQEPAGEARIYLVDLPRARRPRRAVACRRAHRVDLYRLTKTALRWGALEEDILAMLREAANSEAGEILARTRLVRQERRRVIRKLRARAWFWGLSTTSAAGLGDNVFAEMR